ncbi:unnamed protein product [Lepeophtheirus salmonis]|uniref:(salmon louse) hypothetical protein n=1 Tax=Lepeophtheirus salmonis TaxID=72036 RepID=A0A7R8CP55_LEPSM|nr:unnamed protein product [Lepeophtheirus salmonis]CAF2880510.1 unnamed protein product [Lepeophtheirus salmonis]
MELKIKVGTVGCAPKLENCGSDNRLPPLPKLTLPLFDGKVEEFSSWLETFQSIICNQDLSSVSKFTYLRSALKGSALLRTSGLSICNDNYDEALKVLTDSYDRGRVVISKLINIASVKDSFKDLHKFHDDILLIQRSRKGNDVCIDNKDTRKFILPIFGK